ncbi:MAG: hypothetical protein EOO68_11375 [Moraxellaceae bacterium]|nr:MAG: hypothetical protein EOO68_11375 [Moraxellaceae bacterium]
MKKLLLLAVVALVTTLSFGQAKKPTLMVVPSDVWCNTHGYMTEIKDQGRTIKVPDYQKAFQENADLINVISKINGLMADRGFPLKNLESTMKSLQTQGAEDMMMASSKGSGITETPYDKIMDRANADIVIQLTWVLNQTGPKKSVTFNLQGLDSYTSKQVATAQGTGAPSFTAETPVLLEEAVLAHLDNFTASLQNHFDDMFANGREITIRVKKFDTWNKNLESEFNGQELSEVIEDWVAAHTVKGRFSTAMATENNMIFEQVRIPLFEEGGRAVDARRYVRDLSKFLQAPPYNITNKLVMKGLGQANIILGDK